MGSILSGEVFRVLLILMSHLSHTAATAIAEDNGEKNVCVCVCVCVMTSFGLAPPSLPPSLPPFPPSLPPPSLPPESLLTTLYSAPLQSIMRSLVGTIQSTPGNMQRARAHLYGTLLYYLMVAGQHPSEAKKQKGGGFCIVAI